MNSNDSNKSLVSRKTIIIVLLCDFVLLALWAYGHLSDSQYGLSALSRGLPAAVRDIATLTAAIFGVIAAQKGVFTRGGTQYYTKAYGERKLKTVLNKLMEHHSYADVVDAINKMLRADGDPKNSEYFKYVYRLQKIDSDFVKVWNDYNYYDAIVDKNKNEVSYFKRIEKYIFTKVFQEKMKAENKK